MNAAPNLTTSVSQGSAQDILITPFTDRNDSLALAIPSEVVDFSSERTSCQFEDLVRSSHIPDSN
jgi:hypothetical protein